MASEPYRPLGEVQIGEKEHNPLLQVRVDVVNDKLASNIDNFHITQRFVCDRLI